MGKGRLEAFSDGVIAIIITIMVLELKVPSGGTLDDLAALLPTGLAYLLSFINVGIYWNNHHHLFHMVRHVNGAILWANLHLLFWLSLLPFTTAWMGQHHAATWPTAIYGLDLLMSGFAYYLLVVQLRVRHGEQSELSKAIGRDWKGIASILIYGVAIALSFVSTWLALALYASVAGLWFCPDRRIERRLNE